MLPEHRPRRHWNSFLWNCRLEVTIVTPPVQSVTKMAIFSFQWRELCKYILRWRHNERDGSGNDWRLDCISNRLFRRRSKKTSMFRVTVFVRRIHRWAVNSPHKGPVTRKMFLFKDVIMNKNDVLQRDHTMWLFYIYGSGTWKLQECKCAWWWMMESLECKLT